MRFPGVVALYCWGGGAAWTASSEKADGSPVTKANLFYNGNICHLGDISAPLTTRQVDERSPVDVLLVPTGGR